MRNQHLLTPPIVVHWCKPPSEDGLLDIDLQETAVTMSTPRLDKMLWEHFKFYKGFSEYIQKCIACRDSAKRMGVPYGSKQEWWDFVLEVSAYMARIESRMMFVLEEIARRSVVQTKCPASKTATSSTSLGPLKKRRRYFY